MNLKKDLMTFLNRTKAAPTVKAGEVSMKDGDHGTIFGVNRKIVIGTAILFLTIFVIAYIFAAEDAGQKQTTVQTNKVKQEAANTKLKGTDELPNDYADLVAANRAAAKKNGNMHPTNGINNNTAMNTSPQAPRTSPLPQVPYSQPYSLPSSSAVPIQGQQQVITKVTQVTDENLAENGKDKFKAAIAFALGSSETTDKSNSDSATSASTALKSTENISYVPTVDNGLQAGTIIPVILCSGINTDVGGQVVAQISSDIYDSLYGSNLLIPAGSRLLGSYEAGKASTDGRVSITFNTLILPDGGTYAFQDCMVAVDGAGYAGIAGRVNNHTGRTLSSGVLSTALAAVAGVAGGNNSTSSNNNYSTGQLAAQGAMSNFLNTASSLFQKDMNIQATVTVEPGYEFNIFVTKPMSFQ